MNEAETTANHIDPAPKAASWSVVEHSRIERFPLCADHTLHYRNTKLAVL
jgi:hypothetical protein